MCDFTYVSGTHIHIFINASVTDMHSGRSFTIIILFAQFHLNSDLVYKTVYFSQQIQNQGISKTVRETESQLTCSCNFQPPGRHSPIVHNYVCENVKNENKNTTEMPPLDFIHGTKVLPFSASHYPSATPPSPLPSLTIYQQLKVRLSDTLSKFRASSSINTVTVHRDKLQATV